MTIAIAVADRTVLKGMISASPHICLSSVEVQQLDACLMISSEIYVGLVDGELACVWGLIPPTLMSSQAYLWLYTTALVEEHKFLFVRHSQRWMERALQEYETIVGFCKPENKSAIKWLEWLGADFKRPFSERADFTIRKRYG